MGELSIPLSDSDLRFLVRFLMPEYSDRERMTRALRDDDDILEGMLSDDRVFRFVVEDPESLIFISPVLYFAVILCKVMQDLREHAYTVERGRRHSAFVFDSAEVVELLSVRRNRAYLVEMLGSFVRVNSFTIPVRIRRGMWRKYRFSDFDIDSLLRYSGMLEEEQRFDLYKRIADVCLFLIGLFPDYVGASDAVGQPEQGTIRQSAARSKLDLEDIGRTNYEQAARHRAAELADMQSVLHCFSEHFALLAKALSVMGTRYVGMLRNRLFFQ